MQTYRSQFLTAVAAVALAADKGTGSAAPTQTIEEREAALKARELDLAERELEARERALAIASGAPAQVEGAQVEDPAETERQLALTRKRGELMDARAKSKDPEERRAIARDLVGLETDEMAELAADLRAHGSSLAAVLRKAAHTQFGIAL